MLAGFFFMLCPVSFFVVFFYRLMPGEMTDAVQKVGVSNPSQLAKRGGLMVRKAVSSFH